MAVLSAAAGRPPTYNAPAPNWPGTPPPAVPTLPAATPVPAGNQGLLQPTGGLLGQLPPLPLRRR
jgi:hypothetical protein